ncbi:protein split ends-like [Leptidea sinapis]|uniref:protein split ends-like n=1 Tax=Leptidea sinapis TaxID=189913 RepID=UPI0021C36D85|nr:protein split ends-like [Leptidea sinapis]
MVRETRHLWVGNLPDNVREDKIREHFKRGEESTNNTCAIAATAAAPANWRGTNDSATEFCRRGNSTPASYGRSTPLHRWYGERGGESTPSTPGGLERRRPSGSASSRSECSSPEPSDTSRASTPAPPGQHQATANHRTPTTLPHQWSSTANGRPLAICVRNLPTRSTDSSLKDGLYHEYKKHGKVVWVKVVGQNADRYAVVRFKKPSDVEKALEVSQDKLFFGCKISVAPHQSCDDDAESAKPYETDIDEYHPKATRTLFIGNLEKDVSQQQLRDKFKHFGRIIEIDIKKGSGGGAGYAFCQYASISSVVEAIRAMDGEYVGSSRVKLGFGKPVATTCVWIDGLTEHTEKQVLAAVSRCGAATSVCVDRAAGAALVHFEQAGAAGGAVRELRRLAAHISAAEPAAPRLCVDYGSRECQDAFYEQLEKHGGSTTLTGVERLSGDIPGRYVQTPRHDQMSRYESSTSRSRGASFSRSCSRTPRYNLEHYDPAEYAADRRYRVYDELDSSSPTDDLVLDDRLQSVVVSPHRTHRHKHDSSPEERKHSKERHRSAGGSSRRSRSGSRSSRHVSRRRHRRRRDGSDSRASRAGTPLRDEPDAPPTEPRRPPRERPPLPMSLPLPKFALQMLRNIPPAPRLAPEPPTAPASPPRPPSVSSSSGDSAPHSPSLEERIRSLDEKYEKWSGIRAHVDAPDRTKLRHRLLELDINEVKPSEVVRSLLAKRSVFDEDSERLEGAVRPPSPGGSPRSILQPILPRTLRYPFPVHPHSSDNFSLSGDSVITLNENDRVDPRHLRHSNSEPSNKSLLDLDSIVDSHLRFRNPSIEKSDKIERKHDQSPRSETRRNSILLNNDESRSLDSDINNEKCDLQPKYNSVFGHLQLKTESNYSDMLLSISETHIKKEKNQDNLAEVTPISEKNDDTDRNRKETEVWGSKRRSSKDVDCMPKVNDKLTSKTEEDVTKQILALQNDISEPHTNLIQSGILRQSINGLVEVTRKNDDTNKETLNTQILIPSKNISKFDISERRSENTDKKASEKVKDQIISTSLFNDVTEKGDKRQIDRSPLFSDKQIIEIAKALEMNKTDTHDKSKVCMDHVEKDVNEFNKEQSRTSFKCNNVEKYERDKKNRDETSAYRANVVKSDTSKIITSDKPKENMSIPREIDSQKRERVEKERRRELIEIDPFTSCKQKKDEKYRHDRHKREICDKRESKKDIEVSSKSRKSSRDETCKDMSCRKDSTDSSTSRTSHDSHKHRDTSQIDEHDVRVKVKLENDLKETKTTSDIFQNESKIPIKEEKDSSETNTKSRSNNIVDLPLKSKTEMNEKPRHYSFDSTSDSKRKDRLNSCSSLPSNLGGQKRRMSSQDFLESVNEDTLKKSKNDVKTLDRRESKDFKFNDRHKTAKFNKGHFAKLLESKTKDDKKNQVKPTSDLCVPKDKEIKEPSDKIKSKIEEKPRKEDKNVLDCESELYNNLDFLATLELRSSEEDERQKALRNEMKEKKRIQQLQQIHELQIQQSVLQQSENSAKCKDEKKHKQDEKKKEMARDKRMSTERKSKDGDPRRKSKKHSSDSSDSDEPKKHSIFDIVDDEPTYISMYDKVKARSCKNMQKQEEEKRQEKIKAKFSQLKQSRAKREEKKRSSWDEDSDSEHDRQKPNKTSIDSSSEDDDNTNTKRRANRHRSSGDYDRHSVEEYFSTQSNDDDFRNKLSRKNSRTRIMSDSSDEDNRKLNQSPNSFEEMKKGFISENEIDRNCTDNATNQFVQDKIKKTSLLNLFGKSDSDDSKIKSNLINDSDNKSSYMKAFCDISSENESLPFSRNPCDARRRHKKKQKKFKNNMFSDEDAKVDTFDEMEKDSKQRNSDKMRRHSKKERRKDKIRESFDTDDTKDDRVKIKKEKRPSCDNFETVLETHTSNSKREGKMEDIFGPLSDESDKDTSKKIEYSPMEYNDNHKLHSECDEETKSKEDSRRRKEKKRKEKKYIIKDDDNSLDVDAVSKAIEARLFDESLTNDGIVKTKIFSSHPFEERLDGKGNMLSNHSEYLKSSKYIEKIRKESKERRKRKKKSREERHNRKEHHHYSKEKLSMSDLNMFEKNNEMSPKTILNIPLPNEKSDTYEKSEDCKSLTESPSLPRITDSPPFTSIQTLLEAKNNDSESCDQLYVNDLSTITSIDDNKCDEISDIPMPPPIESNVVQDISEVPLPKDPPVSKDNNGNKTIEENNTSLETFDITADNSEDAVRSIPNLESDSVKHIETSSPEIPSSKCDKKLEEKPRAIISQEETADAVAALLGESFGGKADTFANCYEEDPSNENEHNTEIGTSPTENENILEEDAEEMRQAVQNLNASEMEIKPETPVSDNDLLLIDTDTEETEDISQDGTEKLMTAVTSQQEFVNTVKLDQTGNISDKGSNPGAKLVQPEADNSAGLKLNEIENEKQFSSLKPEPPKQITSTATPVITSWTLSNNKIETQTVNTISKDDSNLCQITANILQIKPTQSVQISNTIRPTANTNRVSTPYQVINQIIRPQVSNMQPPNIKIPDNHVLIHKPQNIVISPRMASDTRMLSPKANVQNEGHSSPRLTNMTLLSKSPQSPMAIVSQSSVQQRSPGQVTVVRMQQPPLSPIQTMHIPHGVRAMISPNRPNSVLVQTQGTPIQFNRLPVASVLAPISKQSGSTLTHQNKNLTSVNTSSLIQQKNLPQEKNDTVKDGTKIILSPTRLPQTHNPTIMAQNRLLSMQNALHVGTVNSLHLSNKLLINNKNTLVEKQQQKSDHSNLSSYNPPIIHVANVNLPPTSIIQSCSKPVVCNIQETAISRSQSQNVIQTINPQLILTGTSINNVVQIESSKGQPTVLSLATIRPPTVLTKSNASSAVVVSTSALRNVVMTPLLLKTSSNTSIPIRLQPRNENLEQHNTHVFKANTEDSFNKNDDDKRTDLPSKPLEQKISKCETDFEELLKDNTNEIKITKNPDKKLEVNVGKTVTVISQCPEKKNSTNFLDKIEDVADIPPKVDIINNNIKNDSNAEESVIKTEKLKQDVGCVLLDKTKKTEITESKPADDEVIDNIFDIKEESSGTLNIVKNVDESDMFDLLPTSVEKKETDAKTIDDNEFWSAKDINIESVIKKVDSLCNENVDLDIKHSTTPQGHQYNAVQVLYSQTKSEISLCEKQPPTLNEADTSEYFRLEKHGASKRGGRTGRGRKNDKHLVKAQSRQNSKPTRGGAGKRGRGRSKVDKKVKNILSSNFHNMPGDVYDFHEDSGDETSSTKTEARPRLILTIKSPLSGNSHAIPTSTLSISQKDQTKPLDRCREEKSDIFASPSTNTRKSRRLQEKDNQKGPSDDLLDDIVKGCTKNTNRKRPARQQGIRLTIDKGSTDTRKSPRGRKRSRGRSTSDASIDSSDENSKKDEIVNEAKMPKLAEPIVSSITVETETLIKPQPTTVNSFVSHSSTPITKPPKKMISEISAKLASAFEAAVAATPNPIPVSTISATIASPGIERPAVSQSEHNNAPDRSPPRPGQESTPAALGQPLETEAGLVRRLVDNVPSNMVPVGATEATDARVQSPALPHRPPSTQRPADRSTPVLVRYEGAV